MSAVAVTWSLDLRIPSGPKSLLRHLAWRAIDWKGLLAFTLKRKLAEVLCVSPRTVQRHLRTLEELGLIIRTGKPGYQPEYLLTGGPVQSPVGDPQPSLPG